MKRTIGLFALGMAAALQSPSVQAADHRDGASVLTDPSTDINDVYSWMSSDGTKVYLAMTVFPAADKTNSKFSTAAYYVFHTTSRATFGATQVTPVDVVCGFDSAQYVSCWVGNNSTFVYGSANATAGISNAANTIKVYTGARKDHFFFNLDGYNRVRANVKANVMTLVAASNAAGCPTGAGVAATLTAQRMQLGQNPTVGLPVSDFFAPLNTLAIVLEIDKTLLNKGGGFMTVWGGTYRKG